MQQVIQVLELNLLAIVLGLIAASFLLFILMIILFVKNKKLKKRYNEFMRGTETDIEGLLRESIEKSTAIQETHKDIKESISGIQAQLNDCVQKVGIVKYNAIEGPGAELSFAIALLDNKDNGFVINGIYTRDGSYTYAKEISQGKSKHSLSDEEKEAIVAAQKISSLKV